jgi:hypothetical protein
LEATDIVPASNVGEVMEPPVSGPTLESRGGPGTQPVASVQDPIGMRLEEFPVDRIVVGEHDHQIGVDDLTRLARRSSSLASSASRSPGTGTVCSTSRS